MELYRCGAQWLEAYFTVKTKPQLDTVILARDMDQLLEGKNALLIIRHLDLLDIADYSSVLKVLLLCIDIRQHNPHRFAAIMKNYRLQEVQIKADKDLASTDLACFEVLCSKITFFLDQSNSAQKDSCKQLQILTHNIAEFNHVSNSKNYLILFVFEKINSLIADKINNLWGEINQEYLQLDSSNYEKFMNFYRKYCLCCGLNKKISYCKLKNSKPCEIDSIRNDKIEKIYQSFLRHKESS